MNKEQALSICSDFRPVTVAENKVKCRFYNDDGVCKRPEYFRCELLVFKEAEERRDISTISVSRVNTILRCPRLYALNYVYGVEPPLPATWKVVGRVFSDTRAKIDLGLPYQIGGAIDSMPVDKARVKAVLRLYSEMERPYGEVLNEIRVFFPYKDTHFIGFIDTLTRNRLSIYEWKYASTEYDEIKALRQAAVYFEGIPESTTFTLSRAKKPLQRLKDGETPTELEQRIYQELCKKKHEIFTYTTYDREFFDIPAALEQIYQASRLVDSFEQANWPPALGMNCDNCDFRPFCLKHMTEIGCDRRFCSHPKICETIRSADRERLPAKDIQLILPVTKEMP